jgi:ATP-binding cassette subfamily B protein
MAYTARRSRLLLLRRLLVLVWQSAPEATLLRLVLLFIQAVLPLASLYLMKLMIEAVTASLRSPSIGFGHVLWLIAGLGGVTLAIGLCGSLAVLVGEVQGLAVTDCVQSLLHAKSVAVDLAHYENAQYYDAMHRAQQEAHYRPMHIVDGLARIAQSGLGLAALAGLLFSLHWVIAAVLLVAAVPGALLRLKYSQQLYLWQRRRTPTERQAWYFQSLLTGEAHAKEIRLFDLGSLFIRRFNDLREILRRERLHLTMRTALTELSAKFAGLFAIFGTLAYLAYKTVQGTISLGGLVMYYQAFQNGQNYLQEVLGGLANLYEDSLFLTNLYEFLDWQPRVVTPCSPHPLPRPMQHGITFNHVHFGYDGSSRAVLDDVTLTIRPGEHIALVGANGAGKTTLIKLLCRLYDPTRGSITLDGIDLRELDLAVWRRQISVLLQDYARYYLTARDNIWLGNTLLAPDDGRIEASACASGADSVIRKLPHGYETRLGKWLDDEQELSIGEWQKIALARAFIRISPIVVLDEPTSALDASAEYEVFQKFRQLADGRMTILVSHRFSTVRMAGCIYVLANGRITETGSHDELMQRGGEYARMFELQARNYR